MADPIVQPASAAFALPAGAIRITAVPRAAVLELVARLVAEGAQHAG